MKLTLNGPTIIASLLILVGLFFFLWRGCGGNGGKPTPAEKNLVDSAMRAVDKANLKFKLLDDTLASLRRDSIQQRINTEALAEEANKLSDEKSDAEDATKSYQAKYADARKQVNDLLALATCDSLTRAITAERAKANAAIAAVRKEVTDCGNNLLNRNKQIAVLNQQVAVLKQPANIVNDALHAVKAATKEPWIKGYVGASVMGNQTSFGFGPDVSLLFRGGVMVRGGAVLMGSQVMGQIGVAKLLSFKRK